MSRREFIKRHREVIDYVIRENVAVEKINNTERELWIVNHEGLYLMAKGQGVKV